MSELGEVAGHAKPQRLKKIIAAIVLFAIVALGFACWSWLNSFRDIPFDREAWLSYEVYSEDTTRMRMCSDLCKHYLKPGMTRNGVRKLLGKPDSDDVTEWHYDVGPEWLRIDRTILCIQFDNFGKVMGFRVTQS